MTDGTHLFMKGFFVISTSLWSFVEERCVFSQSWGGRGREGGRRDPDNILKEMCFTTLEMTIHMGY